MSRRGTIKRVNDTKDSSSTQPQAMNGRITPKGADDANAVTRTNTSVKIGSSSSSNNDYSNNNNNMKVPPSSTSSTSVGGGARTRSSSKQRRRRPWWSFGGGCSSDTNNKDDESSMCLSRAVVLRSTLVLSLLASAALCAALAYTTLTNAEVMTAQQTYNSIAAMALSNAQAITLRKLQGSDVMSSLATYSNPNTTDWPCIFIDGFIPLSSKVASLGQSATQAYVILVQPDQVVDFERHFQQTYIEEGRPSGSGYSDFGFGIFQEDPDIDDQPLYADGRLHDTTGETNWGGKRNILAVMALHSLPDAASLMYNHYSEPTRGRTIDSALDCVELHNHDHDHGHDHDLLEESPISLVDHTCMVVTDFVELFVKAGPASLIYQPIFPANDPKAVVGFSTTSLHWEEVLLNIVPDYVSGLTCVITTGSVSYTFEIRGGIPILVGSGDFHDRKYSSYGQSVVLNDIPTYAATSAQYKLEVYPTETMFSTFQTNSPLAVSLAFLGVIVLCTLLFFAYDVLMRHEANRRKLIQEMKRRFVRFISHEIRTPLNTVCVGLELLERELRAESSRRKDNPTTKGLQLSLDSATPMEKDEDQHEDHDDAAVVNIIDKTTSEDIDFWYSVTVDVRENAGIAVNILNDMLNYDKLETGTLDLEAEPVNISVLIQRIVHQFQIEAVNKDIDLKVIWKQEELLCGYLDVESSTTVQQQQYDVDPSMKSTSIQDGTTNSMSSPTTTTDESTKTRETNCTNINSLADVDSTTPLIILGDDVRLSQVLRNIISNALKFTPAGGSIHVIVAHLLNGLPDAKPIVVDGLPTDRDRRRGSISVRVVDTGVGLSKEQVSLVFAEGVQFEANRLQHGGGSGLGLNIAKGIVDLHQGTIKAESAGPGQGTTFSIELPVYEGSSEWVPDPSDYPPHPLEGVDRTNALVDNLNGTDCDAFKSRRILIVEDSISSRKMLIRLLEREGYDCSPAANGKEAVRAIAEDMKGEEENPSTHIPYNTILMDFEMPILNGPDATAKIRKLGYNGTILGVTGNVLLEDVDYFKAMGANDVLAKPISLAKLQEYWSSHH